MSDNREAALAPTTVVRPPGRWPSFGWRELWANRELLVFLAERDIKVRYAQTLLGASWAVLQPLAMLAVFYVVFRGVAKVETGDVPYPVFCLTGLVGWSYFSGATAGAADSLVAESRILSKVYFPRLLFPLTPVVAGLAELAIGSILVALLLAMSGVVPHLVAVLVVPVLVLLMMLIAAGAGCWLSALNVQYRDVRHAIPFMMQLWMFASPVAYPISLVPEHWRWLYALNPMTAVLEGLRVVLLGIEPVDWRPIWMSFAVGIGLYVSGVLFFRRMERVFADVG